MRLVEEIPHHTFKISVFNYNEKYIIKIELAQYEQSFKVPCSDVNGMEDIKKLLNEPFLESVMHRFLSMREDFSKTFQTV